MSDKEKLLYEAYMKKVRCLDTYGIEHEGVVDMLSQSSDEEDGIPGIGISDGIFLKLYEIESIEIINGG